MWDESCLHNSGRETGHQYPDCLFQMFSVWPSFSVQGSKTWKSRQLWRNQVSLTITWTQQSDQNCFTGNRQTNINNACELNYCSTWLVLNQLLPRKLTQSFSPAGEKCALTAVLSPWSQTKNKTLLHIPTMSFHCLSEFMFLFYPIPHSLLYVQEDFFLTVWHWWIVLWKNRGCKATVYHAVLHVGTWNASLVGKRSVICIVICLPLVLFD